MSAAWTEAIDAYLLAESAAGRPKTTRDLRRDQLTRFAREIGCEPSDLTADQLVTWVGKKTTWSIETRRSNRVTLNSFTSWAHAEGIIERSLSDALPKVRQNLATPRPAPDEVWAAALARADDRTRLMLRLAAEAGLRRAEVAKVHRRDLLPGPCLLVHGKGAKDRVVPITDDLAQYVRAAEGYLFPGRFGGHMEPKSVGNIMGELLPTGWSMHTLRHRFATRAYRGSRNLRAVQMLLGHASVATTQRYVAVSDNEIRAAMMAAVDQESTT